MLISIAIGWKKLRPKDDYAQRITRLEAEFEECERAWERVEKSVDKIRDILIEKRK